MWREGCIRINNRIYRFWVKHYEEPSSFGINEGRISKLTIKRDGVEVCNYDRGWDIKPADDETECALAILLESYN